jgi:putative acetyltransferase
MIEMGSIQVRREQPGDEAAIAHVNEAAFGQSGEARLVHAIRQAGHPAISLVATTGAKIAGHIFFTPVDIESIQPAVTAFGLGPMAVLPELQRRGIGSRLVEAGLRECAEVGCEIVVVIGHPEFYPRFGFRPARTYGLRSQFAVPDEAFMAVELSAGALAGRGGLARYLPQFDNV